VNDPVTYELAHHVATITYNRPDALNAINGAMRRGLNDAFARFRDDEDAWVAIVTGAGRAFCAGADVRDGAGSAGEFAGTFWEKPTLNSFESGWEIFKPVIAAVNGYCLGYGLTLVTWCDFVIASERAEFGYPEVGIGVPTIVGAIRLPQRINWQYAMELLLTGERIDARRAKEIGLAGWVVPHDSLMDEANALADRLVRAAPLAARATKEVAMRARHLPPLEAIRFGETMRKVVAATEDAVEGGQAMAEGRPPVWRGR
jgi:enoyl-CoA hydratase/carnithine racemase